MFNSLLREDTIAAISTPLGEGGIGVVRLSGSTALTIAERIFSLTSRKSLKGLPSHTIHHGFVVDPLTGERVDEALLLIMKAPRSYTTEDTVEISCHGGLVPLRRTLGAAFHAGARLAEPGEFTLRAFLHGRIDLAQAEAVEGIVRARTERGLQLALRNLEGRLSHEIRKMKEEVISLLAEAEAAVDFPEEELDILDGAKYRERLKNLEEDIKGLIRASQDGRIYQEGIRTVIVGRPNVGKSSILNALLGEDRAIVSPYPGTTRDTIEGYLNYGGIPFRLIDTAGLRHPEGLHPVEEEGVMRSRRSLVGADLLLVVLDGSEPLTAEDKVIIEEARDNRRVIVINKADLVLQVKPRDVEKDIGCRSVLLASAKTGFGIEAVKESLLQEALEGRMPLEEGTVVANLRHQEALSQALRFLGQARESVEGGASPEFVAIDLRASLEALGIILGERASEDVLKDIFSRFCIGK